MIVWLLSRLLSLSLVLWASAPNPAPKSVSFGDLPLEILESILSTLSFDDYLSFRRAYPNMAMSRIREMELIARASDTLSLLEAKNFRLHQSALGMREKIQFLLDEQINHDLALFKRVPRFMTTTIRRASRCRDYKIKIMMLCSLTQKLNVLGCWEELPERMRNAHRFSILEAIICSGNTELFRKFIDRGPKYFIEEWQILAKASCNNGSQAMAEMVVNEFLKGASKKVRMTKLIYALKCAVVADRVDLVEHLMLVFAASSTSGSLLRPLFKKALAYGRLNSLKYILSRLERGHLHTFLNRELRGCMEQALAKAAENGNLDAIKALWWDDVKLQVRRVRLGVKRSSIHLAWILVAAAAAGHQDVVGFFLSLNSKKRFHWDHKNLVPTHANAALIVASQYGHLGMVKFLLENESVPAFRSVCPTSSVFRFRTNAILTAAKHGQLGVLRYFIKRGPSRPHQPFEVHLQRALVVAAYFGQLNIVKYLLKMTDNGTLKFPLVNSEAVNQGALREAIRGQRESVVAFFLRMENGEFILPGIQKALLPGWLNRAVHHEASTILSFLLQKDQQGRYKFFPSDLTVDLSHLVTIAIHKDASSTLKVLLERNENHQFSHFLENPSFLDHRFISLCVKHHSNNVLSLLLERNKDGAFLFPEFDLEGQFEMVAQFALNFGHFPLIALIADAFPLQRDRLLWMAINSRNKWIVSIVINVLERHIQLSRSDNGDSSRAIPHPAFVAIGEKDVETLTFLLARNIKFELIFIELFPIDTFEFLRDCAVDSNEQSLIDLFFSVSNPVSLDDDAPLEEQ